MFRYFSIVFLLLVASSIPLWPQNTLCTISIPWNLTFVLYQRYGLFSWMFHVQLRKEICFMLLFGRVLYKCHLEPIGWLYCLDLLYPCWFFPPWCVIGCQERGVEVSNCVFPQKNQFSSLMENVTPTDLKKNLSKAYAYMFQLFLWSMIGL